MIYNSFNFIVLYPLIFLLYYLIPAKCQKGRNVFLLVVSYLLYLNWKPIYALILFGVTAITYFLAIQIKKSFHRRRLVWLGGGNFSFAALVF